MPRIAACCVAAMPKPATLILPLQIIVDGSITEVPQATIGEIYAAKKKAVPKGWKETDVLQVKVTYSLEWRKRRGSSKISRGVSKVIVNEEEYTMFPTANTARGNGNKHVLPVTRMNLLPKGEKPTWGHKKLVGTKGNGGWLQGEDCGAKLRKVFENTASTKDELLAVADQYIEPPDPQYNVKDDCFLLRSGVAGRKVGRGIYYGCVGATDAVARVDAQIQICGNALSWRDADNIQEDEIYQRMCPEIQAATRLSLLGRPYKGKQRKGRLDEFTVTVLTAQDKAIREQYVKDCETLKRPPRVDCADVPSRSWDNVDRREGRGNHAAVRLGVERVLQLCAVEAAVRDAVDAAI